MPLQAKALSTGFFLVIYSFSVKGIKRSKTVNLRLFLMIASLYRSAFAFKWG